MQLSIHELEARPDWPLIVTTIPCRTCEAQSGALCCDVGARKLSGQIITRADYHAERKYDAALAWLRRGEVAVPETPPVSAPPEGQPSTTADTGYFIAQGTIGVPSEQSVSDSEPSRESDLETETAPVGDKVDSDAT